VNRHIIIFLIIFLLGAKSLSSQIVADTFYIPNYPIPEIYYTDEAPELPDNVWNHKLKYFPDSIIEQIGSTCGQASGIFNCLTYMFNRAYDRVADSTNTFPPNYTFNILSRYYGVSSFDSWNIVKSQGHPSRKEYETISFNASMSNPDFNYDYFEQFWMNGYDNYYKSFFNRISRYYSLNLSSEKDLILLKHFLHNGFEENKPGGIAMFCSQPLTETAYVKILKLPDVALKESNAYFWVLDTIFYHQNPTHQMTLVGYYQNDSIDFNNDGIITDTIDTNNDGIINFHDNETTLWLILNSWGNYQSYFLLKYDMIQLFWNQQVFFPIPDTAYSPELTFKIKIKHSHRGNLKISAGISSDINSSKPEIVMDLPVFNFQGGPFCMTGVDSLAEPDVLEFGIDITDLKNYIPENGLYKVFMNIENHGVPGELQYFSIIDYSKPTPNENQIVKSSEIIFTGENYYSKLMHLDSRDFINHPKVVNETSKLGEIYNKTELNIIVEGGKSPYEYSIEDVKTYSVQTSLKAYPSDQNVDYDTIKYKTIIPDWKVPLVNDFWDTLKLDQYGILTFINKPNAILERRYPYEIVSKEVLPTVLSPYARYFFWGSYTKPTAVIISDTEIEIFRQYTKRINSTFYYYHDFHIKITKDGIIEVTYSDSIPQSNICAQIRSNVGNYFTPYVESDSFNTVTFTPIIPDSLFTIDSTGLLTMQAVSKPGVYEVYVKVKDANGDEFTKRFEFNIIDGNLIGDLYPNPTNDMIYFSLQTATEQIGLIEIFDISGRLIYKESIDLRAGINNRSLNINSFCNENGSYLLRASFDNKSQVKRFILIK
jgi:hypothetical protein